MIEVPDYIWDTIKNFLKDRSEDIRLGIEDFDELDCVYKFAFEKRELLEQDGLYKGEPEHWEMWEGKVYYYPEQHGSYVHLPMDILRHLELKHKEKVQIAIRRGVQRKTT